MDMPPTYHGIEVPVFPADPNWAEGFKHGLIFRTDITEALSTAEDRAERYPRPLNQLEYQILTRTAVETAYLRQILDSIDDLPVGVPFWPMRTKLTAVPNTVTLTVDSTTSLVWTVDKPYALLWRNTQTWEIVELVTVASGTITLYDVPAGSWVAGDTVVPLLWGTIARGEWSQYTDECASFSVQFKETFNAVSDRLIVVTASLPAGLRTVAYATFLEAAKGMAPYAWSIVGDPLPPGLAVTADIGKISGTPTRLDDYPVTMRYDDFPITVRATDQEPATADKALILTINPLVYPSDYTGLIGWWKADSFKGTADNTRIGGSGKTWTDLSGNGNHWKMDTVAWQPFYRTAIVGPRPAIQFTITDQTRMLLDTALTFTADQTIIIIYQQETGTDAVLLYHSLNRQIRSGLTTTGNTISKYDGVTTTISCQFNTPMDTLRMATVRVQGAIYSFFDGKTLVGNGNEGTWVTPINRLGSAAFGNYLNGHIAELCIWNEKLEVEDILLLYNEYFGPRWGLP